MSTISIEERLTALEKELSELQQQFVQDKSQVPAARWERIFGTFANSEGFEEAVRLGREYRESLSGNDGHPISRHIILGELDD